MTVAAGGAAVVFGLSDSPRSDGAGAGATDDDDGGGGGDGEDEECEAAAEGSRRRKPVASAQERWCGDDAIQSGVRWGGNHGETMKRGAARIRFAGFVMRACRREKRKREKEKKRKEKREWLCTRQRWRGRD